MDDGESLRQFFKRSKHLACHTVRLYKVARKFTQKAPSKY